MKKWFSRHMTREMIRPLIYTSVTRWMIGLCAALLWDRFVNTSSVRLPLGHAFVVDAAFWGLLCWLAWMRMRGVKLPAFDRKLFVVHKKPYRGFGGDMADYLDEEPVSFDELEDEEKDTVLFLADMICAAFFLIGSFFVM